MIERNYFEMELSELDVKCADLITPEEYKKALENGVQIESDFAWFLRTESNDCLAFVDELGECHFKNDDKWIDDFEGFEVESESWVKFSAFLSDTSHIDIRPALYLSTPCAKLSLGDKIEINGNRFTMIDSTILLSDDRIGDPLEDLCESFDSNASDYEDFCEDFDLELNDYEESKTRATIDEWFMMLGL